MDQITSLFSKSGYELQRHPWGYTIVNRNELQIFLSAISFITGILLGFFAAQTGSWKLALLAIILIGVPFTSHRLFAPKTVRINQTDNKINIRYSVKEKIIDTLASSELVVDYYAKSSFVSPFQEGNQDHYYSFEVTVPGDKKPLKLFRLTSRKQIDNQVEKIMKELFATLF